MQYYKANSGFLFDSRFSYPSKNPFQPAYLNYDKFPVIYLSHASAIQLNPPQKITPPPAVTGQENLL